MLDVAHRTRHNTISRSETAHTAQEAHSMNMLARLLMLLLSFATPSRVAHAATDNPTDPPAADDSQSGDVDAADTSASDSSDDAPAQKGTKITDPAVLQAELDRARADAARERARAKERADKAALQAAETATSDLTRKLAAALGVTEDEPDAEKLGQELTQTRDENRRLRVELAIRQAANGADLDLLIPFLRGNGSLDGLDPSAEDFANTVRGVVSSVLEDHPQLKAGAQAAPTRSANPPHRDTDVSQLTREDAKRMTPDEIERATDEGRFDVLLGRS